MITSETYCHFIRAEPLIGFRIDVQNSFSDLCVFDLTVRFLMIQKLVVCTAAYIEDMAESGYFMFAGQDFDSSQSLSEWVSEEHKQVYAAIAFF